MICYYPNCLVWPIKRKVKGLAEQHEGIIREKTAFGYYIDSGGDTYILVLNKGNLNPMLPRQLETKDKVFFDVEPVSDKKSLIVKPETIRLTEEPTIESDSTFQWVKNTITWVTQKVRNI